MSVLFGGSFADELAENVRKQKEEFETIDIDTHFKQNQWKNKSAETMSQQQAIQNEIGQKLQLSKSMENSNNEDLNAFINNEDTLDIEDINDTDSDSENTQNKDIETDENDVEYLDVRGQTIFRYSNAPKISKYDKKKNAKKSSLSYIQNNNVRTSFKNTSNDNKKIVDDVTYFKDDPFMNQKLLRQNFVIDRGTKDHSMIKDKTRISKLARNNLQFIKEVLISQQSDSKKNLLFDKRKFNRKLRFVLGAPNKRKQRNYKEFQHVMRKRQSDFDDKKDLYFERGLRVQNKLNDKVLFNKFGRRKIWNAGRTKKKNGKRKGGNVGSYELAKNINDW